MKQKSPQQENRYLSGLAMISDDFSCGQYISLQCEAPPVISWFRFAPVTIVINTIDHSYLSYNTLG